MFWDLTLAEFEIKAEGYFHRQERQWQHTRFIASFLYAQSSGKIASPEEIRPTIFDDPEQVETMRKAEKLTKKDVTEFEAKWLKSPIIEEIL